MMFQLPCREVQSRVGLGSASPSLPHGALDYVAHTPFGADGCTVCDRPRAHGADEDCFQDPNDTSLDRAMPIA